MSKKLNVDKLNGYPYTDGGKLEVVGGTKPIEIDPALKYSIHFNGDYKDAKNLKIIIPDFVNIIPDSAFYTNNKIEYISIPHSVTYIGEYAFRDCQYLKELYIPNSVQSIGTQAFFRCVSLESITFEPDSQITTIPQSAFARCNSLETITLPDNTYTIYYGIFIECNKLKTVYLPNTITHFMGDEIFSRSASVDIYYDGTEEQWNSITGVDNLVIPEGCTLHFTNS